MMPLRRIAQRILYSDRRFVRTLYRLVLGRNPDPTGLRGWLTFLRGNPEERQAVVRGFLESEEASKRWGGLLSGALVKSGVSRTEANSLYTRASEVESAAFLGTAHALDFSFQGVPEVSVVVVHYGKPSLTYAAIASLRSATQIPLELVVVDNDRSLERSGLSPRLRGARYLPQDENLGFVKASNLGAREAKGRHLLFLNNDVRVFPGAVEAGLKTLAEEGEAGAVVGRILHFHGLLQEAGSLVWRDGSTESYGRGEDPEAGEFRFRRDVDYGSAAFLLTPAALFGELGGFDEAYSPGYYEDVDYCLRLWEKGWRVVYEPQSAIWHCEGGTFGPKDSHDITLRNRALFVKTHGALVGRRPARERSTILENRACVRDERRALVVDDRISDPRIGSGHGRARELVLALRTLGYSVTLFGTDAATTSWNRVAGILPPDVEFIGDRGASRLGAFLDERLPQASLLVVSRRHNFELVERRIASRDPALSRIPVLYDMESMACEREILRRKVLGESEAPTLSDDIRREFDLARIADVVIVASDRDRRAIHEAGIERVVTLRHVVRRDGAAPAREQRRGLLFVGAFHAAGTPNSDSMDWFVMHVLPHLQTPGEATVELTVAGFVGKDFEPPWRNRGGVRFVGPQVDLDPLYDAAAVFVAPTRFAGGIPIKVLEAAVHGVPAVVSPLLAEQLGWTPDEEILVAPTDDPKAFAQACRRLLNDAALWSRIQAGARERARRDGSPESFRQQLEQAIRYADESRRARNR